MHDQRSFRVFYRDYVNGVAVPSSAPETLAADRVGPLAEALLQHADNFLGVVDRNELIVQAYLDDDEQQVFLELLYPENQGLMRLVLNWADAVDLLAALPDEFDESLLPGADYIG
jgi:hypothetical protein